MNQAKDTETDKANNGYQKSGIRFPQDSSFMIILEMVSQLCPQSLF